MTLSAVIHRTGGPEVIAVVENRYRNGLAQDIILENDPTFPHTHTHTCTYNKKKEKESCFPCMENALKTSLVGFQPHGAEKSPLGALTLGS